MKKLNVAVIYGGTSTEHEVAIITALQLMHALLEAGHQVIPIYISKQNHWYVGDNKFLDPKTYQNLRQPTILGRECFLRRYNGSNQLVTYTLKQVIKVANTFDIAYPVFHGKFGEDGTIQGLLTLLNIPLAGSSLLSASIGMDKYLSKSVANTLGIPTVNGKLIYLNDWLDKPNKIVDQLITLGPNLIIKPSLLGSSIGISITHNRKELTNGLDVAFQFDHRVLVETLLANPLEVQISIMGNDPYALSITEQPLKTEKLLSYEDKYVKGQKKTGGSKGMASLSRLIPAPITSAQKNTIHKYAQEFYRTIGGRGLARVDFLIHKQIIYFNEINIIPGSLAFYLWEKTNKPFTQLANDLIQLGMENYQNENQTIRSFESNILANLDLQSGKGKT